MPYPQVINTATWDSAGAAVEPHYAAIPTGVAAGDLLLNFWARSDVNNAGTTDADWTIVAGAGITGAGNMHVRYRIADGSESGNKLLTTIAIADAGASITYLIRGFTANVAPEGGNQIVGGTNSTTVDPPLLTPTWATAPVLWFVASFTGANGRTFTVPSGYGNATTINTNMGSSSINVCRKESHAASENPGTGTWSGAADDVNSITVGVRGRLDRSFAVIA
jgi:hypothetical protein